MNFLAHQYLSFNLEPIMVGNFLADTLRGKQIKELPPDIAEGVKVHHEIDGFTDSHPIVLETRKILYPYFGKYASVVQDVYYDHFLARDWHTYSSDSLSDFCDSVYAVLAENEKIFNERAKRTFHYMQLQNWLLNYSTLEGLHQSLSGLSRRASFENKMNQAIPPLNKHRTELESQFNEFFPELERRIAKLLQV